jgi:hypothetical protein
MEHLQPISPNNLTRNNRESWRLMWNSLQCASYQWKIKALSVAKQNKIQKQFSRRETLTEGNDISWNCIWHCVPQKMRLTAEKNGHCFCVSWCNKTINQWRARAFQTHTHTHGAAYWVDGRAAQMLIGWKYSRGKNAAVSFCHFGLKRIGNWNN